ncbi:hypothetical protein [Lederbergia lenta]|uniref:hypothetical protein n=1 Tax=Lederbergia lenta TaxID=1467 RepID=UPI0011AE46FC|nr:hypothetical protein [Lederbergia lenta]MCM3109529.1 hypothetical protein [Lederbergia lenta]MEC2324717.1 hypothetical protein [Lederbergia lenta]
MNNNYQKEEELNDKQLRVKLAIERMIAEGGAVSEGWTDYPRKVDSGTPPNRRNEQGETH